MARPLLGQGYGEPAKGGGDAGLDGISTSKTVNSGDLGGVSRPIGGQPFDITGGTSCTLIDFEGIGDNLPIGVILGTPNVTFGTSWLGIVDADALGSGNFANEPTPDTAAYYLDDLDNSINFDSGVQFVEVPRHRSAAETG